MRLVLISLILIISSGYALAQNTSNKIEERPCPMDRWTDGLGSAPPTFLGLKDAPAKISATGWSGLGYDKTLKTLDLENLSGKTIKAVKINWFLYRVDKKDGIITPREKPKFIMQGESPSIETEDFKPNEETTIAYWIGSCQEIYDALVKDGETEGIPWLEATVQEILFADGSTWTR